MDAHRRSRRLLGALAVASFLALPLAVSARPLVERPAHSLLFPRAARTWHQILALFGFDTQPPPQPDHGIDIDPDG